MNRLLLTVVACAYLSCTTMAWAKDEPARDGVQVGKVSPWSKLVPQKQVEAQAFQQYEGLKSQAQQHGALAPESDPQVQRLRRIARDLIPHTRRWSERASDWQWEVNLIASNQVNAFCMPGGKIAFFTGILKSLKLTDDEVAIVMGHEMAHALREHAREKMAKGTALQLGAALTSSLLKLGDAGQYAVGKGAQLMLLKFSRNDETEADLVGLDIAARAGYDPRAGIALWQKMGLINKDSRNAPPQWLSTHPAGDNRIQAIRRVLPDVMPLYAKVKGKSMLELAPYKSNVAVLMPIE